MDQELSGAIHDKMKAVFISSVTWKILPQYQCHLKTDYDELFLTIGK